ncbi:hypothetical protein LCGC14_1023950 [marine sediment metagenome]|uniref:Uncharacterized protein n=1 Tax=marine sediment metagenome TaxID=412755 RepID=A0A0F9R2E3_9ZZZZ
MAYTFTNLEHANNTTDLTSYDTGSISPTNGKLVIVTAVGVAVNAEFPTLSGLSMTWDEIIREGGSASVTENRTITVFRGIANGNTGALTIDFDTQTQGRCLWSIVEVDGVVFGNNGADAIVQAVSDLRNNVGAISSFTLTMAAFASGSNATFGAAHSSAHTNLTPGSGFTEIGESEVNTQVLQSQRKTTADTTVDWTFSNVDTEFLAIGLELTDVEPSAFLPSAVIF